MRDLLRVLRVIVTIALLAYIKPIGDLIPLNEPVTGKTLILVIGIALFWIWMWSK